MRYVLALTIKPVALKFYMERLAFRLDNDKGYAWPAQDTIAKELSVSRKTVQKLQAEAEKRGYIRATGGQKKEKGQFAANHYEIPGFLEWLTHVEEDANSFFVRAIGTGSPCELRGGTVGELDRGNPVVARPWELRGGTDRGNYGVAQKERGKEREKKEMDEAPKAPRPALSNLAGTRKANKESDATSGYAAFVAAYRSLPRSSQAGGLSDGRKVWLSLSAAERAYRLAALNAYADNLRTEDFKQPQHIDSFLDGGWEDFAKAEPTPVELSPQEVERNQTVAVAIDLQKQEWCHGKKWWSSISEVPAAIIRAAQNLARAEWYDEIPETILSQAA
jgi:hypothetical protein